MSEHPITVDPNAYNTRVMAVNLPMTPKKARKVRRGANPDLGGGYAAPFGISAGALRNNHCTGRNY